MSDRIIYRGNKSAVVVRCYGTASGASAQPDSSGTIGEDIGAFRIVKYAPDGKLYLASNQDTTLDSIAGMSLTGSVVGGHVIYTAFSEISDPFFDTFSVGPVFLGVSGGLTQTSIDIGWLLPVGSILTPGTLKLAINIATAIERN